MDIVDATRREAYSIAGSGSGSVADGTMPAARLKIATTVEARIISNVVKVFEIRARGLVEKNDDDR